MMKYVLCRFKKDESEFDTTTIEYWNDDKHQAAYWSENIDFATRFDTEDVKNGLSIYENEWLKPLIPDSTMAESLKVLLREKDNLINFLENQLHKEERNESNSSQEVSLEVSESLLKEKYNSLLKENDRLSYELNEASNQLEEIYRLNRMTEDAHQKELKLVRDKNNKEMLQALKHSRDFYRGFIQSEAEAYKKGFSFKLYSESDVRTILDNIYARMLKFM